MADIQKIKDKAIKDNQELAEQLYKINNQIKKLYLKVIIILLFLHINEKMNY